MEVYGIMAFFMSAVLLAVVFAYTLLGRALERDRRYQLAVGELQPAPPALVLEEEPLPTGVEFEPVGTLALLLIYLMVLIGLWLAMFAVLMGRS